MACSCNSEGTRTVLWVCWTTNFLITSIFYILSFATCANLVKSYKVSAAGTILQQKMQLSTPGATSCL
jgi:hypothetical protein